MKNRKIACVMCLAILMATTACGNVEAEKSTTNSEINTEKTLQDESKQETIKEEKVEDGIAQAIAMEQNSKEELDKKDEELIVQASEEVSDTLATVSLAMPNKYSLPYEGEKGSVEAITYEAKDYRNGGEGCEKKALYTCQLDMMKVSNIMSCI